MAHTMNWTAMEEAMVALLEQRRQWQQQNLIFMDQLQQQNLRIAEQLDRLHQQMLNRKADLLRLRGMDEEADATKEDCCDEPLADAFQVLDESPKKDSHDLVLAKPSKKGLGFVVDQSLPLQKLKMHCCKDMLLRRLEKLELRGSVGCYDGMKATGQFCEMWHALTLSASRMEGGSLAGSSLAARLYCSKWKAPKLLSYENHGWKWAMSFSFIVYDPGKLRFLLYGRGYEMANDNNAATMDVDVDKSSGTKQPKCPINMLRVLKFAQMQHELHHGVYTRHRRYCTARLRGLSKSLRSTHGRGKHNREAIAENIAMDVRFFHILLYTAERAWGHAMEERQLPDGPNRHQRIYLIGWLRKAIQWASLFAQLCANKGDFRTCLEAEAYALHKEGNLLSEQYHNWDAALRNFKGARAVYGELGKYGDLANQLLCREQGEELEPRIRYCLHKIGQSNLQASALLQVGEIEGPALDLFISKLEAVTAEARSQSAMTKEPEKDLHGPTADSLLAEKKLSIFNKIFAAYHDARSSIRNDLATTGSADNVKDALYGFDKALVLLDSGCVPNVCTYNAILVMLLESQILCRLGRFDACVQISQALQKSKIDSLEITFVAGLVATAQSSDVQETLDALRVKPTSSFGLAYNTACSLIERTNHADTEQLLLSGRRVGQEAQMDDNWADDAIENELVPIAVQLAYVQQLPGHTQEATETYLDIVNLREAIFVNRVLLLLHANGMDQVRELVTVLLGMLPASLLPVLLQAAVWVRENTTGKAVALLGQFAEKFPDNSRVSLLARTQVGATAVHFQVAVESLAKVLNIQHMPATVAIMVALKERAGNIDGDKAVVDSAIKWWSSVYAAAIPHLHTIHHLAALSAVFDPGGDLVSMSRLEGKSVVKGEGMMQGYEDRSWLNEMERGPLRLRPLVCWLASYMRRGMAVGRGYENS